MNDKIALVSCSGLSPLGLVVRAATVELALDNENIVAACITEYSAQPNQCSPILEDAKVVSITGCTDDCVSTILKEKDVYIVKNIDAALIDFNDIEHLALKLLVKKDDWFYITNLQREIDKTGIEIDTLTLEKFLRTDRDGKSG